MAVAADGRRRAVVTMAQTDPAVGVAVGGAVNVALRALTDRL
jgi:hypothetical protein